MRRSCVLFVLFIFNKGLEPRPANWGPSPAQDLDIEDIDPDNSATFESKGPFKFLRETYRFPNVNEQLAAGRLAGCWLAGFLMARWLAAGWLADWPAGCLAVNLIRATEYKE